MKRPLLPWTLCALLLASTPALAQLSDENRPGSGWQAKLEAQQAAEQERLERNELALEIMQDRLFRSEEHMTGFRRVLLTASRLDPHSCLLRLPPRSIIRPAG